VVVSALFLLIFSPLFLLLALAVKLDSPGPVFYRQVRVGRYNRDFKIYKFRTMVQDADKIGLPLTTGKDPRITRVGLFIRKLRLDEFSQLLNVLNGSMSLVGPRPEVRRYVDAYTPEYLATLLIRPGVTAPSSIAFKDEDKLLNAGGDPEKIYVEKILPPKMELNLEYMRHISVPRDIRIMFQTVAAVF
jgi:lipopolysaccharide/colanic/teichoic acid biosynthesis glycosyltransferase